MGEIRHLKVGRYPSEQWCERAGLARATIVVEEAE